MRSIYTPKYMKEHVWHKYEYPNLIPSNYILKEKYDLLIRYGIIQHLDGMVYENKMNLIELVEIIAKSVNENSKREEFFKGISINALDMLNGDISELADVICDRMKLLADIRDLNISNWISNYTSNVVIKKQILLHYYTYFDTEV